MDYMKYIKQLAVIMAVSFVGELLNLLLPLPIPASVYGLVLMFLGLVTKVIRLEQVEGVGTFLVKIMPVLFISSNVSLMTIIGGLVDQLPAILAVCIISMVIVMAVTGWVAQWILGRKKEGREYE